MQRPADYPAAIARARSLLAQRVPRPMTWLEAMHHLDDARDALGRPLDDAEAATHRALAAALWTATADGYLAELADAIAQGAEERNTVRRILDVALVAVRKAAPAAGTDWDGFAARHRDVLARGRALLTPRS